MQAVLTAGPACGTKHVYQPGKSAVDDARHLRSFQETKALVSAGVMTGGLA